jgi:tellurite resistance protein
MTDPVARHRPKMFPPPEFPPRWPKAFARTPPAVFPALLGGLGLALALRAGVAVLGWPQAAADLVAGVALALWAFAALAYGAKLARRPSVIMEDLKVLPGRAGLAAGTAGGMAAAAVLAPYAPGGAVALLIMALVAHAVLALLFTVALRQLPPEQRVVTPAWHLSYTGFIVGAVAAMPLGLERLAEVLLWATIPVAMVIWAISAVQLVRRIPPAPLRPLLAIHLAPASLFATVAVQLDQPLVAGLALALASGIAVALLIAGRWIAAAGPSPMWGAFTFPLAALSGAMLTVGGMAVWPGMVLLAAAVGVIPAIGWMVLKAWPGGRLAARTNAAEA